MFGRVMYVCDANPDIIESVPALAETYDLFKLRVAADNDLAEQVPDEEEGNGFAENKDKVWEELGGSLNSMLGGLRAYAKQQNNIELFTQAKFAPGRFLQKRGSDAINYANSKLALLTAQVANLADYNVTTAKITAATALSANLYLLNPKPLGQRSVDKALRSQLFKQIKETNKLLKERLDSLMLAIAPDHPYFVQQYFNARRLVRTGIRHRQPEEETANASKLKTAEEAAPQQAASQEPEEGHPAAEGGQPDTNGSQPPTESPNHSETSGETA